MNLEIKSKDTAEKVLKKMNFRLEKTEKWCILISYSR